MTDPLATWPADPALVRYCEALGRPVPDEPWLIIGVTPSFAELAMCFVYDTPAPESFAYTVGLVTGGLPELWVTGLVPEQAHLILWAAVSAHLKHDVPLEAGGTLPAGAAELSVPLLLRGPVDRQDAAANLVFDDVNPAPVLQVLWPDSAGVFPDEASYDTVGFPQRLAAVTR